MSPISLSSARARRVALPDALVTWAPLPDLPLPIVASPARPDVDLVAWLAEQRPLVADRLLAHGAILFRGFAVTAADLPRAVRAVSPSTLDYVERSTPRSALGDGVYTSTEYPADQAIPMHHENAYSHACPRKLWLFCDRPAGNGGETPLADGAAVYAAIEPAVRDALERAGVLYVRNFRGGEDLSWQTAFQTHDRAEVEAYCAGAGIACTWLPDGSLRTCQTRTASIRHPDTGVPVWFNQAHLFHTSSLDRATQESLAALYAPADLPRHAWRGDAAPLDLDSLAAVRGAYERCSIAFPWEQNDLLLVDNLRVAHGRRAYSGPRRVVVAMSEAWIDPARCLPSISPAE
jgi:alpha-ketoglutarate-dependent taurine dioxygenase